MVDRRMRLMKDQRVLLALVIMLIIAVISIINPRFIALKNIVTILQQISVLGILTMGMSLLLISGGIDLSIGNIMILSGVIVSKVILSGGGLFFAIVAGLLTGISLRNSERHHHREEPLYSADHHARNESDFLRGFSLTISGGAG